MNTNKSQSTLTL